MVYNYNAMIFYKISYRVRLLEVSELMSVCDKEQGIRRTACKATREETPKSEP